MAEFITIKEAAELIPDQAVIGSAVQGMTGWPEEIGIDGGVKYCPMPVPDREHNFLAPLYTYLPGAIFAGFRHTTIGEPMFRGGMDPSIFIPTYYSPVDVVDL